MPEPRDFFSPQNMDPTKNIPNRMPPIVDFVNYGQGLMMDIGAGCVVGALIFSIPDITRAIANATAFAWREGGPGEKV